MNRTYWFDSTAIKVRRCFWIFFALATVPTVLQAQVSLDFFGGANTNAVHLTGKSPIRLTPRINTLAGIQSGHYLSERWALSLAVQYAIRGYGDTYYNIGSGAPPTSPIVPTTDFRFHYLDLVPKVSFDVTPHFKLNSGIYAARLLDSYIREANTDTWAPLAFGSFFSDWDFGFVSGFSMHYQRVFFFANFNWSVYPLASFNYTGSDGQSIGVARMYNRTFQIGLGYTLINGSQGD